MIFLTIDNQLTLKTLIEKDAHRLFSLIESNRAYLRAWLPWLDHSTTEKDSSTFIKTMTERWLSKKGFALGIWLNDLLIGTVGFNVIDRKRQLGKIGYWLSEAYQGRGIATQAVQALITYGFQSLDLRTITINCAEKNAKSRKVAERLGFHFDKVETNKEWLYDHYVNHVVYSLKSHDWRIHKQ